MWNQIHQVKKKFDFSEFLPSTILEFVKKYKEKSGPKVMETKEFSEPLGGLDEKLEFSRKKFIFHEISRIHQKW